MVPDDEVMIVSQPSPGTMNGFGEEGADPKRETVGFEGVLDKLGTGTGANSATPPSSRRPQQLHRSFSDAAPACDGDEAVAVRSIEASPSPSPAVARSHQVGRTAAASSNSGSPARRRRYEDPLRNSRYGIGVDGGAEAQQARGDEAADVELDEDDSLEKEVGRLFGQDALSGNEDLELESMEKVFDKAEQDDEILRTPDLRQSQGIKGYLLAQLAMLRKKVKSYVRRHKMRIATTVCYCLVFCTVGIFIGMLGPTLPELQDYVASDNPMIPISRGIGYLAGSLAGGKALDWFTPHWVVILGSLGLTASIALTPVIASMSWLLAILVFGGLMGGLLDVCSNTLVVWTWKDSAGPWLQLLHFCFGMGAILSTHLDSIFDDLHWTYYSIAVIVAPASLGLFFLESPQGDGVQVDVHAAHGLPAPAGLEKTTPQEMVEIGEGSSPPQHSIRPSNSTTNYDAQLEEMEEPERKLKEPTLGESMKIIFSIGGFFFMCTGAEIGVSLFFVTYLQQRGLTDDDEDTGNYITAGFWAALTLGRLVIVPLAAMISPRVILLIDIAGCIASSSVMVFYPKKIVACWMTSIGIGAFMASTSPAALAYPAWAGLSLSGQAVSWILVIGNLGELVVPLLIAALMNTDEHDTQKTIDRKSMAFVWINFLSFVCAGVFLVFMILTLTKSKLDPWRVCRQARAKFSGFNRVTGLSSLLANSFEEQNQSSQTVTEEDFQPRDTVILSISERDSSEVLDSSSPSSSSPSSQRLLLEPEELAEEDEEEQRRSTEESQSPTKTRNEKPAIGARGAALKKWRVFGQIVGRMLGALLLVVRKKPPMDNRRLLRISRDQEIHGSPPVFHLELPSPTSEQHEEGVESSFSPPIEAS